MSQQTVKLTAFELSSLTDIGSKKQALLVKENAIIEHILGNASIALPVVSLELKDDSLVVTLPEVPVASPEAKEIPLTPVEVVN